MANNNSEKKTCWSKSKNFPSVYIYQEKDIPKPISALLSKEVSVLKQFPDLSLNDITIDLSPEKLNPDNQLLFQYTGLSSLIDFFNKTETSAAPINFTPKFPACLLAEVDLSKKSLEQYGREGYSRVLIGENLINIDDALTFWREKISQDPKILIGLADNQKELENLLLEFNFSSKFSIGEISNESSKIKYIETHSFEKSNKAIETSNTIQETLLALANMNQSKYLKTLKARLESIEEIFGSSTRLDMSLGSLSYEQLATLKIISNIFVPKADTALVLESILEFIRDHTIKKLLVKKLSDSHNVVFTTDNEVDKKNKKISGKIVKNLVLDPKNQKIISATNLLNYHPRFSLLAELNSIYKEFTRHLLFTTEAKISGLKPTDLKLKNVICTNCIGNKCGECLGYGIKYYYNSLNFKGINISSFLKMKIIEAMDEFCDIPKLHLSLLQMSNIGLNNLTLDCTIDNLSFNQLNRIKILNKLKSSSFEENKLKIENGTILGKENTPKILVTRDIHALVGNDAIDGIITLCNNLNTTIINKY